MTERRRATPRPVARRLRFDPFVALLETLKLPAPVREYRFCPDRLWRADYCWPAARLIVERDGGVYRGGRNPGTAIGGHSSVSGIRRDMEKSNAAQMLGFVYLRFTPRELDSGAALATIRAALERRP
jgi:hypothetical protein